MKDIESIIIQEIKDISIRRINRLIEIINVLFDNDFKISIEKAILKKYRMKLEDKMKNISDPDFKKMYSFDISEIESELALVMDDINIRRDFDFSNDFVNFTKTLFHNNNIGLIIFNSNVFEFTRSVVFDEIIFIGMPFSLINEERYVPLIGHEIGHFFYRTGIFPNFNSMLDEKIKEIEDEALNPPTNTHVDKPLLEKAKYLRRVIPQWEKEIFSDLFAASIWKERYASSFALFQIDKAYLSVDESDPTNKLRFITILKLLKRIGFDPTLINLVEEKYEGLIHTDNNIEAKTRGLFPDKLIEVFIEDFLNNMKSNTLFNNIKERFLNWDYHDPNY